MLCAVNDVIFASIRGGKKILSQRSLFKLSFGNILFEAIRLKLAIASIAGLYYITTIWEIFTYDYF